MPCGSNSSFIISINVVSSGGNASILLAAITCGRLRSSGLYFASSSLIALISSTGSLPSTLAASTIWIITLVLSMCFKNSCPRPIPSLAPSIRPGISAITKPLLPSISTTPRFGASVVK